MKSAAIHPLFAETLDRHFHLSGDPKAVASTGQESRRLANGVGVHSASAMHEATVPSAHHLAFILMAVLEENAILKRRLESIGAAEQEMDFPR